MHTVELLLDPALDDLVRSARQRLHAAGLPSLATHRHPTNRPHLTLAAADRLTPEVGTALAALRAQDQPRYAAELRDLPAARGNFPQARTYNSETRTVTTLS